MRSFIGLLLYTVCDRVILSHLRLVLLLLLLQYTFSFVLQLQPLNGLFSGITRVSEYQKGKTSLDLNDGVLGWQWHQLDHMQTMCTSLETDNGSDNAPRHSNFSGCYNAQPCQNRTLKAICLFVSCLADLCSWLPFDCVDCGDCVFSEELPRIQPHFLAIRLFPV